MNDFKSFNKKLKAVLDCFNKNTIQYSDLFRSITENPLIGVYIVQDNQFKYVSKGWSIITGYSLEETVGKMETLDIIVPSDIKNLKTYVQKRMSGSLKTSDSRFRIIKKDGSLAHVKVYGNIINYEGKQAVAGILIDITKQIAIEDELKENAIKYKNLIENSLVGVYLMQDGKFKYANDHFCDIFGYTSDEIIDNIDPPELVHDDDKNLVRNNIKKRITRETPVLKYEFKGLKKDKSIVYVQVLGSVMQYKDRPAIMGTIMDITELKEAEDALKKSEHLFQTLLNLAPYPISVTNNNLHHRIINESFCKVFKVTEEEVIGKTPMELGLKIKESEDALIEDLMKKNGKVNNFEITLYDRDKQRKVFLYSCIRFHYNQLDLVLNTFIDITDRKAIQEELAQHRDNLELLVKDRTLELNKRNEELNNANKLLNEQKKHLVYTLNNLHNTQQQLIQSEKMASLGFLSAGIAHEINNPLNFIHGGSLAIRQYLEENPGSNYDEAQTFLDAIEEGIMRTSDIVSSLNHYSRKNDNEKSLCQINNIIDNCLIMLKSKINKQTIINKSLQEDLPLIKVNEGQLHQVLLNIINNSIQAINPNNGQIDITTKVENKNIQLEISDNGKGIPKDILNNVFDPFFTTKSPGEGTGLGLSISYNIIKEHNGTIKIDSHKGKWTKVEIYLPLN